ncbi:MAG: amidohydrolase family protein [Alphaproteobacteria bacterium]|jgi:5-methylthioadenosine/S-adenosylhomocysteine deaminase|nr:amidohydrolase family protein [Rhodospirillaceae bacterium]MBT7645418.1 amidohydrolase family protein [Rhodospirillaceae bacterium]MDG2481626.1 amidohydrolase family protein [Alphaproteobacteria bacterium]
MITVIRNAAWIAAWDEARAGHVYLRDCDLAFEGNTIIQVGGRFEGAAAEEIDGSGLFVMPGLIDLHCHSSSQPLYKGLCEEVGNRELWWSGLYDNKLVFDTDDEAIPASTEVALAEVLQSGVTTLVDLCSPFDGWIDRLSRSGLRAYAAPMFGSGAWHTDDGRNVIYDWFDDDGRAATQEAVAVIEAAQNDPSGRLAGMPAPSTTDLCSERLLGDVMGLCQREGWRFHIHASESVHEVQEMRRRHGVTPIRFLADRGLLTPRTIVAHAIYADTHSWITWSTRDDIALLAEARVSVAHCPTPFARYGAILESFGGYRDAGINLGIGTDTTPHNMLDEMRWACVLGKVAGANLDAVMTADVFDAATTGGARALGRDDIGRLAVGAKADLVLVDLTHPMMRPTRDPLRVLLFHAAERAVRDVYVDGRKVVENGVATGLDYDAAVTALEAGQQRSETQVGERHWSGRGAREISPLALPDGEP